MIYLKVFIYLTLFGQLTACQEDRLDKTRDKLLGEWKVIEIKVDGEVLYDSAFRESISMVFSNDSTIQGYTGRNHYWASYELIPPDSLIVIEMIQEDVIESRLGKNFYSFFVKQYDVKHKHRECNLTFTDNNKILMITGSNNYIILTKLKP